jgi:predicted transcriptional regulator
MTGFIRLSIFVVLAMLLPESARSDLIVLKDGTQVKAQKVWEENDLVRFTLPDYDGIVVTYAKEIVLRIEKEKAVTGGSSPESRPQKPASESAAVEKDQSVDKPEKRPITAGLPQTAVQPSSPPDVVGEEALKLPGADREVLSAPVVTSSSVKGGQTPGPNDEDAGNRVAKGVTVLPDNIDENLVHQVTGIQFYDPRRPYKYQTGPTARYRTLKEAVDDLAAKFDKTPRWVELNLGDTNDLGQIYRNLSRRLENVQPETESEGAASGLLFYDPRRAEKYWVSPDSRHRTMEEAVDTLAKQYDRTPDWIISHLGGTNDLVEIHRNLARSAAIDTGLKSSEKSVE